GRPHDVVLDARAEVPRARDRPEDVPEEDEVDAVARVEGEVGEPVVVRLLEVEVLVDREAVHVSVARGVTGVEADAELILEEAILAFERDAEVAEAIALVGGLEIADVGERAPDHRGLDLEAEALPPHLGVRVEREDLRAAARELERAPHLVGGPEAGVGLLAVEEVEPGALVPLALARARLFFLDVAAVR